MKQLRISLNYRFLLALVISLSISIKVYSLYFNHLNYGDENDNLASAWLMKEGQLIYRDFFSHQYPLPIFLGVPIEYIAHSKTLYRFFMMTLTFFPLFIFSILFKGTIRYSILLFAVFASFGISLYAGQQFEDASLLSAFIISAFFLVIYKGSNPFDQKQIFLFSLLFWLSVMTSPIYYITFVVLFIYKFSLEYLKFRRIFTKEILYFLIYNLLLISIFLLYLLFTDSLNDFSFNTIWFNENIYYYHIYTPYIDFKPLDFYLHTTWDVYNHWRELIVKNGQALVIFAKASKNLVLPFNESINYHAYSKLIFTDLYNNFFNFEVLIAIFYTIGITTLFFTKRISLGLFSIIFIFAIRLRILERIHMASYYFFAFWLFALSIVIFIENIIAKKRPIANLVLLLFCFSISILFVTKNLYDFKQAAFNVFPDDSEKTVQKIVRETKNSDQILILSNDAGKYYYESKRLPFGYFINFFEWYEQSEKLKKLRAQSIKEYRGTSLVVPQKKFGNYCGGKLDQWEIKYYDEINNSYTKNPIEGSESDYIFEFGIPKGQNKNC